LILTARLQCNSSSKKR